MVIHRGYSWDVAPSLRDGFYDGILYDTYPLQKGKVGTHHITPVSGRFSPLPSLSHFVRFFLGGRGDFQFTDSLVQLS